MTPMEKQRKAISGGLVAGLAAAIPAALDGTFTLLEWVLVAGAVVAGWNAVYWPPNEPATPTPARDPKLPSA